MRMTTRLRDLLRQELVVAAGIFDPFSARLAQLAGFEAVHLTGFGLEASQLAAPDLGLLTMTEVVSQAARIAAAIDIPIVADVDTGFGGVLNVQRTIREMERAGVAGIHIEDQTSPKHCPVLAGRTVVSRGEAVDRVKAALDARTDPDFVIVARTDAEVISFEEVVERSNLYLEAGADMVMPILATLDDRSFFARPGDEQMAIHRRMIAAIDGPVMGSGAGPPPGYTTDDLAKAGFAFMMYAGTALGAAANAMATLFAALRHDRTDAQFIAANPGPYHDALEIMRAGRLDEFLAVERKFTGSI